MTANMQVDNGQPKISEITSQSVERKLSTLPYYHYCLPREEAEFCLLNKPGDFLIRESVLPNGHAAVILSVRANENCVKHMGVEYYPEDEMFHFVKEVGQPSVVDLVEYYYTKQVPLQECQLIRPIDKRDWELLDDRLFFDDAMLGEGNFATVYKGRFKSVTTVDGKSVTNWSDCAYKRMRADRMKYKWEREKLKFQLFREFHAFRKAGAQRCLLTLFGVYIGSENAALIMEFCDGGALDSYLKRNHGNNDVYAKVSFLRHAAEGLAHLHQHNLIHRDVAARNFLLVDRSAKGLLPLVKLADYGLTRLGPIYRMSSDQEVPFTICAIESLRDDSYWTIHSDVWSFGVLIYQVFDECQTELYALSDAAWYFNSGTLLEILVAGYRLPATDDMPQECRDIMAECFSAEPRSRPDMAVVKVRLETPLINAWNAINKDPGS